MSAANAEITPVKRIKLPNMLGVELESVSDSYGELTFMSSLHPHPRKLSLAALNDGRKHIAQSCGWAMFYS